MNDKGDYFQLSLGLSITVNERWGLLFLKLLNQARHHNLWDLFNAANINHHNPWKSWYFHLMLFLRCLDSWWVLIVWTPNDTVRNIPVFCRLLAALRVAFLHVSSDDNINIDNHTSLPNDYSQWFASKIGPGATLILELGQQEYPSELGIEHHLLESSLSWQTQS